MHTNHGNYLDCASYWSLRNDVDNVGALLIGSAWRDNNERVHRKLLLRGWNWYAHFCAMGDRQGQFVRIYRS